MVKQWSRLVALEMIRVSSANAMEKEMLVSAWIAGLARILHPTTHAHTPYALRTKRQGICKPHCDCT